MLTIGDLEGRQDIVESSLTLIAGDSPATNWCRVCMLDFEAEVAGFV